MLNAHDARCAHAACADLPNVLTYAYIKEGAVRHAWQRKGDSLLCSRSTHDVALGRVLIEGYILDDPLFLPCFRLFAIQGE